MKDALYLGVDVGTGSARAAVFDRSGAMRGFGASEIRTWRPRDDFVQQSSDDIWRACGDACRSAMGAAGSPPSAVRGIGFDATCSLVVLDERDRPVTVSPGGEDAQNVIVWMDHRATEQAARINAGDRGGPEDVLRYVGGSISPEMQVPKLLWLKESAPETWRRAGRFMDLPDFLSYRATGDDVRSLCTTVCKWTYLGHDGGRWDEDFFASVGLVDVVEEGFRRIGTVIRPMGDCQGRLTAAAASELGLAAGTPVSVSIIDAHAGGVGTIGAPLPGETGAPSLARRLALIGGTSSCHMTVSAEPRFIPGVWGPYYSAMVPGLWLTEGGQSATGSLIDHVIGHHAASPEVRRAAERDGTTVYAHLNRVLETLSGDAASETPLTRALHVLPYFHGNRSPRADPSLRGMVSGLGLTDSVESLALLYLATIQSIAYGTRHIVEAMNAHGYAIDTLFACGGGTKNPVFVREHADATGCRVVLPREKEAVLLGAAILGAVASGDVASVVDGMAAMTRVDTIIEPDERTAGYHDAKYAVFLRMFADQCEYERLMCGAG